MNSNSPTVLHILIFSVFEWFISLISHRGMRVLDMHESYRLLKTRENNWCQNQEFVFFDVSWYHIIVFI